MSASSLLASWLVGSRLRLLSKSLHVWVPLLTEQLPLRLGMSRKGPPCLRTGRRDGGHDQWAIPQQVWNLAGQDLQKESEALRLRFRFYHSLRPSVEEARHR